MSEISIPRTAVLTPPAIVLLHHLARFTVVGDRADGSGLAGGVARDALDELETSGYATRLRVPKGRDPMFAVTPAGRSEAARLDASPAGC
jgi:hypothetical protein